MNHHLTYSNTYSTLIFDFKTVITIMDYSTILGSAKTLKKNSLYKVTIANATQEVLFQLNGRILNIHDAGLTKIEYKLPINFTAIDETVSNAELQTAIYYNIVTELERKDYVVRLQFYKDHTLMIVSWSTKAELSEVEKMKAKLMSLRVK